MHRFSYRIIIRGEIRHYARPSRKVDTRDIEQLVSEYNGPVHIMRPRNARGLAWQDKAQSLRPWERRAEQRKRGRYKKRAKVD